jgi:hypothetical protein
VYIPSDWRSYRIPVATAIAVLAVGAAAILASNVGVHDSSAPFLETTEAREKFAAPVGSADEFGEPASLLSSDPYAAFTDDAPPAAGGAAGPDGVAAKEAEASISLRALVDYDGDGVFHVSEEGTAAEALWRYVITNDGDVPLSDVGLIDYAVALDGFDRILDAGETWTWEVPAPVTGDTTNRARLQARDPDGALLAPVFATASVRVLD